MILYKLKQLLTDNFTINIDINQIFQQCDYIFIDKYINHKRHYLLAIIINCLLLFNENDTRINYYKLLKMTHEIYRNKMMCSIQKFDNIDYSNIINYYNNFDIKNYNIDDNHEYNLVIHIIKDIQIILENSHNS